MLEIIVGALCVISIIAICYGVGRAADRWEGTESENAVETVKYGFVLIVVIIAVLISLYMVGDVILGLGG